MDPPASGMIEGIVLSAEPSDGTGARWVVARAEAELVERYGALHASEQGLVAATFDPPNGAFVVARSGDEVVGGAGVRPVGPGTGEVKRLWVDASWRGRGIGRSVMAALERAALDLHLVTLRLATGPKQPEAVALYEATGWARHPDDIVDPTGPDCPIRFSKRIA